MRRVILDGRQIRSRDALHDYLAQALELPSYYGANLDALHDVLTELSECPSRQRGRESVVTNHFNIKGLLQREKISGCGSLFLLRKKEIRTGSQMI